MTPQQLKNSILQLAIQGELVEQRPEEGTGEDLYREIQAEKARLLRAGEIKKDRRTQLTETPPEDALPFDIPTTWKWVYLSSILNKLTDGTHKTPKYSTSGVKFVSVKDMSSGVLSLERTKYITVAEHEELFARCDPVRGDMLLSKVGTTGVPAIVDTDEPFSLFVSVALLKYSHLYIDEKYLYYLLQSPLVQMQAADNTRGVGNKNWVLDAIAKTLVALPPLAEQKRIVARIEELLPLVERYEQAWSRQQALDRRFPADMQKAILQLAIQGKLVPQRPEEGTGEDLYREIQAEKTRLAKEGTIKKQKPLPDITDDELPFDIPESWRWCCIGDLFQQNTGKALNGSNKDGTLLTYITTSNLYWNRFELGELKKMPFTESEIDKCTVRKGDLLVCEGGDFGRAAIWNFDEPMRIQNHIHRLRAFGTICVKYFYYIFYLYKNTGLISGKGIAIKGLSSNALRALQIPLPPLAEQKRIVAKIEELLPLCEALQGRLS